MMTNIGIFVLNVMTGRDLSLLTDESLKVAPLPARALYFPWRNKSEGDDNPEVYDKIQKPGWRPPHFPW